ncbi:hypothetical protein F7725_024425, partial [Dissostichus mawsoni]
MMKWWKTSAAPFSHALCLFKRSYPVELQMMSPGTEPPLCLYPPTGTLKMSERHTVAVVALSALILPPLVRSH